MNVAHAKKVISFQEIKSAVPLLAVLERYGVLSDFKRMGAQCYGPCPICESGGLKACVVNPSTNEWKCFAPTHDAGGSTLEFVAAMEKTNIPTARQLIARWFAIAPSGNTVNQHKPRRRVTMSGNKPTHKVYAASDVPEGSEEKAWLTRIGAAWPHRSGKGMNIQLQALPTNGRLVLFEYDEEDHKEDEAKTAKFSKKK